MKKLLLVLTFISVLVLGGCAIAPTDTTQYVSYDEFNELKLEVQQLQLDILELQEELQLETMVGLNGVEVKYRNVNDFETMEELSNYHLDLSYQFSYMEMSKETFDKNKTAPDYMKECIEIVGEITVVECNYVTFNEVGSKLSAKYFHDRTDDGSRDMFDMGVQAVLHFRVNGEYDHNDIIARMILMLDELRNYDYYILSSTKTLINVMYIDVQGYMHNITIEVNLVTMVNDFFEITPDGIIDGDYEMEFIIDGVDYTYEEIMIYYDNYILTNELSVGNLLDDYVLNLEKVN